MNKIILALVMSVFSFASIASDKPALPVKQEVIDKQEFNFHLKVNDWKFSQRQTDGSTFFQVGHKFLDKGNIAVRYVNAENGDDERRIAYNYSIYKGHGFSVSTKWEYRDFSDSQDYWRGRTEFKYSNKVTKNTEFWIKLSPRLSFKGSDAIEFSSRDQLGFYYNIVDNIKFGPFIDRSTNTDWDNHTETVIGTNFIMEL